LIETRLGCFDVSLRCGLCLFLEHTQDLDRVRQPGSVDNPKSPGVTPNPYFFDAFANCGHGLEVVWLLAVLYFIKLVTRVLPCFVWKLAQTL
jgi:hypothetical protein